MALQGLISDSAHGDSRAFKAIYDMLSGRVFRYVRARSASRSDALDITQETFVDFWKALPKFVYEDDERVVAFVYTIASRKLARYYHFRKVHTSLESVVDMIDTSDEVETGDAMDVLEALPSLPAAEQEIIRLRYFSGLSYAEIAQLLGESENTLKVRSHRALNRLKQLLGYEE